MNDWIASFFATIAFGLLAITSLLWMGIAFGVPQAAVCASFSAAAAYLSQLMFTNADLSTDKGKARQASALVLQFVSLCLWCLGMWHVLGGLVGA